MKNFFTEAIDKAKAAVENNPDLQKALADAKTAAAPAIQNAIETAKTKATEAAQNFAQTLQQPKPEAGNSEASDTPETPKASFSDKAKDLFGKLPPLSKPDLGSFKLPPIPLTVTEDKLNQLATKAIADDSRIKSLNIQCRENCLVVTGTLELMGLPLNFTTQLALESCELSPSRKVIILRRLDNMALGGDTMLAGFMAHLVKILVCGLFGVDLGAISLKNITGLTISKNLITADLEAMGAMDAIMTGVRERIAQGIDLLPINSLAKMAAKPLLDMAGNSLLDKLHLQNVTITDKGIKGEFVLGQGAVL